MKTGIKHKVMAILTAVLMVAAMIPVMAAPVFADDVIPEYTVTLDPGNGAGQQIIIKSSEEGRIATEPRLQGNGMFFWLYPHMYYRYPDLPGSFSAPDGTKFLGWEPLEDSSLLDDPGADYTFGDNKNITLIAQWGATISFKPNGGSDTMNVAKAKMGESCSLPECGFEAPDGQVFKGWNTVSEDTPDNSGIWYYPGDMLTTDKDVTLYARWGDKQIISLCSYDITNSESGQGGKYWCFNNLESIFGPDSAPNSMAAIPGYNYEFQAYPDDGYSFVGWYRGEPFSPAEKTQNARPYMDWSPVSTNDYFSCKINSDWTLYAVFERTDDLKNAEISGLTAVTYNGNEQTQDPVVKMNVNGTQVTLGNGTDYDVSYSNNVNAGTATLKITGKGDYTGEKTANFTITAKQITPAIELEKTTYAYDGAAKEPQVTVKDGNTVLSGETDYTVEYSDNVEVGTAKVTVTLKGNYEGSGSAEFAIEGGEVQPAKDAAVAQSAEIIDLPALKITKPKAAKKKLTVRWKKVSKKNLKKISGIQIQVATDPGFTNIVKTATAGKKKISKKIGGLQPKTKYYVRIRAYGAAGHYSVWKNKTGKTK